MKKIVLKNGLEIVIEYQSKTPEDYDIVIAFMPLGHRCGYVGVPNSHPLYGKHYDDVDVEIHGGLTYADYRKDFDETNKLWYFGFDCAHCGDTNDYESLEKYGMMTESMKQVKEINERFKNEDDVVRTYEYVFEEVYKLNEQLSDIARKDQVKRINGGSK